jgi:hypothetical protein
MSAAPPPIVQAPAERLPEPGLIALAAKGDRMAQAALAAEILILGRSRAVPPA